MDEREAISVVKQTVKKIGITDDEVIKMINNLKVVLLNLQIENSRIKEHTGIQPIIDELKRNIQQIDNNIKGLISENRVSLIEAIETLTSYIGE